MLTFSLAVMAILGPAALMALWRWQDRKEQEKEAAARDKPVLWNFSVNESLCIGCDKCVHTCPEKVLELDPERQVVRLARLADCVQCRACDKICPTGALKMYRSDGAKPSIEFPDLDDHYQPPELPGLYLVGEPAGLPRIKNAINLGEAAVEHMVAQGLSPAPQRPEAATGQGGVVEAGGAAEQAVDVVIVGAGPGGLSAAVACTRAGLRYALLEQGASPLNTIVRYPKGKRVHALPRELACPSPLAFDECTKEELIERWQDVKAEYCISETTNVTVTDIQRAGAGYVVSTDRCGVYHAQRVVVAIGGFGQPKPLPRVPMSEQIQPHVFRSLDNPEAVRKKSVVVVGGSDSAVEAALALARPELGNAVFLVYYKNQKFLGANKKNLDLLFAAATRREIYILDQSEVVSIAGKTVNIERNQKLRTVPADEVYVLIGSSPSRQFLQKIGIKQKRFEHAGFKREASDALLQRLQGARPVLQLPGGEGAPSRRASLGGEGGLSGLTGNIFQTRFEPGLGERILEEHAQSQRRPTLSRVKGTVSHVELPSLSAPVRLGQSGASSQDTLFDEGSDPQRRPLGRSSSGQVRTEKLSLSSLSTLAAAAASPSPTATAATASASSPSAASTGSAAATAGAKPALPATSKLSEVSPLRAVPRPDPALYRTIRIPTDRLLMRMPDKAVVPKGALTRAELQRITQNPDM